MFALISLTTTALPTLGKTILMLKRAEEMHLHAVNLTGSSIPATIAEAPQTPSATAVPTSSATTLVDASRKGAISDIVVNAIANGITALVQDSIEDDESKEAEDEENEDENKRSILSDVPADVILDIGPILGDDLLSGALVSEEPKAVNDAVDGELGEAPKGEKPNSIRGNWQAGARGMLGGRRAPGQHER